MPTDDRLEEQINQFYENGPDVQDALPMKDYLLKHENNQMAWYLLGKQYLARGQEAKANYCFAQAGPVYEAFESKKSPQLGEAAAPGTHVARAGRRGRRMGLAAVAAAALVLVLGLFAYGERAAAPQEQTAAAADAADAAAARTGEPAARPDPDDGNKGGEGAAPGGGEQKAGGGNEKPMGLMAAVAANDAAGQATLGRLLTAPGQTAPSMLLAAPRLGKWTDWTKAGKPIAQLSAAGGQPAASVDWFDAGWCPCGAAKDAKPAASRIAAWKPLQEGKLVVSSALAAYRRTNGKWPSSPKALAAAYPHNVMSGWNAQSTAWFDELTAAAEAKTKPARAGDWPGWPDQAGPAAGSGQPAGLLAPMTTQPIEIVIDTTRNRLAVVSGDVLLRNYEVGLGASNTPTPLGSFVISEKVRDPNGGKGAFGSRGMALSDTQYAIHGTDEPTSVGKDESHGCVRMSKTDVEELFDLVAIGTKVTIGKGGLPLELRAPDKRFRLTPAQNETNPGKKYAWLN